MKSKIKLFFQDYPVVEIKKNKEIDIGDKQQYVYYLEEGFILQLLVGTKGQEAAFNIFRPGTFFPMVTAMIRLHNQFGYTTLSKTRLRRAPSSEVVAFLRNNPDVMEDLMVRVFIGVDGMMSHLTINILGDSTKKIASTLTMLSNRFGEIQGNGNVKIPLPLTQQEIASLSGTSRETASRELTQLTKRKILAKNKKTYTVKQPKALQQILEN